MFYFSPSRRDAKYLPILQGGFIGIHCVVATGIIESPEQQIQVSALQPGIYSLHIEGQRMKNVKVVVR